MAGQIEKVRLQLCFDSLFTYFHYFQARNFIEIALDIFNWSNFRSMRIVY